MKILCLFFLLLETHPLYSQSVNDILGHIPKKFIPLYEIREKGEKDLSLFIQQLSDHKTYLVESGTADHPSFQKSFYKSWEHRCVKDFTVSEKMMLSYDEVSQLIQSLQIHTDFLEKTGNIRDLVVASEVYIVRDGFGAVLPKTPERVVQISTAGFNFGYDQGGVVRTQSSRGESYQFTLQNDLENLSRLDDKELLVLLVGKWDGIFVAMRKHHVQVPILAAIGLGAFLPGIKSQDDRIRSLTIEAMTTALKKHRKSFEDVIVSIPSFDEKNLHAFESHPDAAELYTISTSNMFDIAYHLAHAHIRSSILNASDMEALASGNLGQFWYNGHVALEESFVYHTTLILNNWAVTKVLPKTIDEILKKYAEPVIGMAE